MKGDDKFKHHFVGWGASDDCAGLTGTDVDESAACHNWFELKLNGEVIGECMMNYEGGWEFRARSNTHKLEVGAMLKSWDGLPIRVFEPDLSGEKCTNCQDAEDEHTSDGMCYQ
jgi:hypothetical protein